MKLNDSQKIEIVEKYKTGKYNCNTLGKEYGISRTTVNAMLRRRGVAINNDLSLLKRKYTINDNYFDKIDAEDKAYWFGWLCADGTNTRSRNHVAMTLQTSDVYILTEFLKCIGSNSKMYVFTRPLLNRLASYTRVDIINKKISEDLEKLGCVAKKSLILKFPGVDKIPESLIRHFVRGFWEGNGSIYKKNLNKSSDINHGINVYGSYSFCVGLAEVIEKYLKIKLNVKNDRKVAFLRCGSQVNVLKILGWLYKNVNFVLKRKYDMYQNFKCQFLAKYPEKSVDIQV